MNQRNLLTVMAMLIAIMLSTRGSAQLAQYHIGSPQNELATKVKTLPDGSVIIAGYNYDISGSSAVNCNAIIMKLDNSYSHILWQTAFTMTGQNANANNIIRNMLVTSDSNIVVVGTVGDDGVYVNNHAAIVKFNTNTGTEMWHYCMSDAIGSGADIGGELYIGVAELGSNPGSPLDHALVAAGCHNFQPATSDGMISVFQSDGTNLYNETYAIPADAGYADGDEFNGIVAGDDGNVYLCGEYATGSGTGSYKNGRVMQYTPGVAGGTVGWTKFFDFTLTLYVTNKNGTTNISLNNNFFDKIYRSGSTLLIHGGCLNTYAYTAAADFVLKLNEADGSVINLRQLDFAPGSTDVWENNTAIAVRDANHIYDVQTPSTTNISSQIWTLGGAGDADITDITDLNGMVNKPPVRFKGSSAASIHAVNDIDLNSNYLFMSGSENDVYYGAAPNNDIYYVVTATGGTEFASINKPAACDTVNDSMLITNILVNDLADVQTQGVFIPQTYDLTYTPLNDSVAQLCGDKFGQCYDSGSLTITTASGGAGSGTNTSSAATSGSASTTTSATVGVAVNTITPVNPGSDTCSYTANVSVGTSNIIYGYGWSVNGTPVILDHTGSSSDQYTFTLLPGGTDIISVTAYIVNPNFTQSQGSPCCEAVFTDTITCKTTCTDAFQASSNVTYTAIPDPNNKQCKIICTANPVLNAGWTAVQYQWQEGFIAPVITYAPNWAFPLPAGTSAIVTCIMYAVDSAGDTCTITRTITVDCLDSNTVPCVDSTSLTAVYDGSKGNGCLFTSTASAVAAPGYYIVNYLWNYLGINFPNGSATPNVMNINVPSGISEIVTVTIQAVSVTDKSDTCNTVLTEYLTCDNNGGTVSYKSVTNDGNSDSQNSQEAINIYPNPTQDAVTITSTGNDNVNTVQVFDVNGKQVGNYSFENTKSASISLSGLVPGTYLLRVNSTTSKIVTKIK
jgi:hypothetical protein